MDVPPCFELLEAEVRQLFDCPVLGDAARHYGSCSAEARPAALAALITAACRAAVRRGRNDVFFDLVEACRVAAPAVYAAPRFRVDLLEELCRCALPGAPGDLRPFDWALAAWRPTLGAPGAAADAFAAALATGRLGVARALWAALGAGACRSRESPPALLEVLQLWELDRQAAPPPGGDVP